MRAPLRQAEHDGLVDDRTDDEVRSEAAWVAAEAAVRRVLDEELAEYLRTGIPFDRSALRPLAAACDRALTEWQDACARGRMFRLRGLRG